MLSIALCPAYSTWTQRRKEQVSRISEEEAHRRLSAELPSWGVQDGELHRQYRTANWRVTQFVANAIGFLAEAANHHPRLVLNYRSVDIFLHTHDVGGLTEKDLALAQQVEETLNWPPDEGDVFGSPPKYWLRD